MILSISHLIKLQEEEKRKEEEEKERKKQYEEQQLKEKKFREKIEKINQISDLRLKTDDVNHKIGNKRKSAKNTIS